MPPAHSTPPRPRSSRPRLVALLAVLATLLAATPALAYAKDVRVDLRLLVVTDGRPNVDAITAQLDREGVPYQLIDVRSAGRPTVTPALLSDTVSGQPRGKFQGIVLAHESVLPAAETAALAAYEQRFKVRQVDAYTWAHPGVGLAEATWGGTVDGLTVAATPAGRAAGFGYLNGPLRFDDIDPAVAESYAALAMPAALPAGQSFTPLVTAPIPGQAGDGSAIGVYAHDGREELVVTVSLNRNQTHAKVLAHGVLEWLTRGVHLGLWRNWFAVHIDDVFLPDDRWHTEADCTVGDDCNPARDPAVSPYNEPIRMLPADVDTLLAWQQRNGLKLDMVFNGEGAVDAGSGDALTAKLLANKGQFRWVNHTYGHPYLGCVQDFSVVPWRCATTAAGQPQWATEAEIETQIKQNLSWARQRGLRLNAQELVTGEHSGLRTLPQMPTDNPNLAPALRDTGIRFIGSDNSRESATRTIGPARTLPRYPMNIYYNTATRAEAVDEYNWIYTREADGGSGICEANPTTSTCIEPLPGSGGFGGYIVPMEARIALGHVVGVDPRPHYAHQSNLAEDRILYPVLDAILAEYRSTFAANTPLVNPRMADSAEQLRRAAAWRDAVAAGKVEAYLSGGRVTIVNRTGSALQMPASAPTGTKVVTLSLLGIELVKSTFGEGYGPGRSAWTGVGAGARLLLRLPA
jgi:hypothetical protein